MSDPTEYAYCSKHGCTWHSPNKTEPCPQCEAGVPDKRQLIIGITCRICGKMSTSDDAIIEFDKETGNQCGALCENCKEVKDG